MYNGGKSDDKRTDRRMTLASGMVMCPHCGGQVIAGFAKCRHCGEWLKKAAAQAQSVAITAQAVTKGIEQEKSNSVAWGCLTFVIVGAALIVSVNLSWTAGMVTFFALSGIAVWWSATR